MCPRVHSGSSERAKSKINASAEDGSRFGRDAYRDVGSQRRYSEVPIWGLDEGILYMISELFAERRVRLTMSLHVEKGKREAHKEPWGRDLLHCEAGAVGHKTGGVGGRQNWGSCQLNG